MTRRPFPASIISLIHSTALFLQAVTVGALAQDTVPYTLHVYTNLIQIPTLVLSSSRKSLPPVPLQNFNISLDGGPVFHPSQMRLEGDDPLDLAILIDATIDPDTILKNFATALAALAPGSLHAQDRVSIYAMDCVLVRSVNDAPASSVNLRDGVIQALSYPTLHGKKSKRACEDKLRLWDYIATVTAALTNFPGRRVLLVVSNGIDGSSRATWSDIFHLASFRSVAIFGLRSAYPRVSNSEIVQAVGRSSLSFSRNGLDPHEDLFQELCESNGGMILNTRAENLTQTLESFVTLLRNRYILEFPRSNDAPSGTHNILVTIPKANAFITTTGILVPVPDAKLLADPNTIPSAPSQVKFGQRPPLTPGR